MNMTFKEAIDLLRQNFYHYSGVYPVNLYMNKEQLRTLNRDLKADPERDLKQYKGSNIVIWQRPELLLGELQ